MTALMMERQDCREATALGSVSQFAALVEIDGALKGMVRLALVQSDLGAPPSPCNQHPRTPVVYVQSAVAEVRR